MRKKIAMFLTVLCCTMMSMASLKTDSLRFSLLTCEPGELVYELFGHTAIRCTNFTRGTDIVYNYGMFDFDAPNFIMRFVRGETDYELGVVPFKLFEQQYAWRGSAVIEQELRLENHEAIRLDSLLKDNYMPQNRVYRYNYFYDNCTSRARDRIEDALGGHVVYPPGVKNATFRGWVRQYTQSHPWADFGIGLCLGAEADRPINGRLQMFLPENLRVAMNHATIHGGSEVPIRKLVKKEKEILPSFKEEEEENCSILFTPMSTALCLLGLVLICSVIEWRRKRIWWCIDLLLFSMQGLAGCVIGFLFFFSSHPSAGSNFLLIILNPLPLLALPWIIKRIRKGEKCLYDIANVLVLTLFIAFLPLIPQKISLVVVLLVLNLLIRSILHLGVAHKKAFCKK
ncbi:MAG: DUF4105 domain-containing protein [Bacteroidaceae bacterium]|nr:DUF4105 domain-containing protein [Bacteroidaceae bacterium]